MVEGTFDRFCSGKTGDGWRVPLRASGGRQNEQQEQAT
jgi:hypothetical protein